MATGVVVRIVKDRGFGFLREDSTKAEYFFHYSAVQRSPGFSFEVMQENVTRVEFEVSEGPKGPRAENVTQE